MPKPEAFKSVFVEEQQIPDPDIYIINSADVDTSNGFHELQYNLNRNFSGEGIVLIDSIEFRNDQFHLTTDDYILDYNPVYNISFTQASEIAKWMYDAVFDPSATGDRALLSFQYEEQNPYTIIGTFATISATPITVTMSYKLARMIGVWRKSEIINSDGDIEFTVVSGSPRITSPIKPFIEKYKWLSNFGNYTYRVSSHYNETVIAEGNFGYPNQLTNANGNQMTGTLRNNWVIKLVDDQGYPHKILSDYEIKFRIIRIIPARTIAPNVPKEWRYLMSKKAIPKRLSKNFRQEVKAVWPEILPKAEALDRIAQLQETNDSMKNLFDEINPDRAAKTRTGDKIELYNSLVGELIEKVEDSEDFTPVEFAAVDSTIRDGNILNESLINNLDFYKLPNDELKNFLFDPSYGEEFPDDEYKKLMSRSLKFTYDKLQKDAKDLLVKQLTPTYKLSNSEMGNDYNEQLKHVKAKTYIFTPSALFQSTLPEKDRKEFLISGGIIGTEDDFKQAGSKIEKANWGSLATQSGKRQYNRYFDQLTNIAALESNTSQEEAFDLFGRNISPKTKTYIDGKLVSEITGPTEIEYLFTSNIANMIDEESREGRGIEDITLDFTDIIRLQTTVEKEEPIIEEK